MIAIALLVALMLVLLFLIGLLLILDRQRCPRTRYHVSPRSRATPLGFMRTVRYDVPLEEGIARARERTYVPGDESADTVKVEVPRD